MKKLVLLYGLTIISTVSYAAYTGRVFVDINGNGTFD